MGDMPCSFLSSHTIANAWLPIPHESGSTKVIPAAAAIAASIALPPLSSIRKPACAANGCDVDMTLRYRHPPRLNHFCIGITSPSAS
jgi:hypothetical protein